MTFYVLKKLLTH